MDFGKEMRAYGNDLWLSNGNSRAGKINCVRGLNWLKSDIAVSPCRTFAVPAIHPP